MTNSQDVSDYDKFNYDYSQYWEDREYEHMAEQYAFSRLINGVEGNWFIDIGGSYGRHLNIYQENFDKKIICDYSLKSLEKAKLTISKNKAKNVYLIAANAYNLPFKTGVFDGISLIRVLHHIEDVPRLLKEVSRVNSGSGYFFLEYANKNNLKAKLRAMLEFDLLFPFRKEPLEQKSKGSCEGSESNTEGIILNFHPRWINKQIVSHGYRTLKMIPVSFLRLQALKQALNPDSMLKLEILLQKILGWSNFSPSMFLKLQNETGKQYKGQRIEDIIVCPKCRNSLYIKRNDLICNKCNSKYKIKNGIFDLRYPIISN